VITENYSRNMDLKLPRQAGKASGSGHQLRGLGKIFKIALEM